MWKTLRSLLSSLREPEIGIGTIADLPEVFERLLDAGAGSFLIIEVPGFEPACLQFTEGSDGTLLSEYPLVTAEQIEREDAARAAFGAVGLAFREHRESENARFLGASIPRDAKDAAAKVARMLETIFAVRSTSELRFVGGNGLTIVLSRSRRLGGDPSQ